MVTSRAGDSSGFGYIPDIRPSLTALPLLNRRAGKAIVPTGSGQIGINPVESDLGDADTYIGAIYGTDTQYIVLVNETSTKWVGADPSYLSVTTISPTNTSTIQVVVATASADGNGQHAGDISMIFPERLVESLKDSFTSAAQTCDAVSTKRFRPNAYLSRREADDGVLACLLESAAKDTADGGLLDQFINPATWQDIEIGLSPEATAALKQGLASLATTQLRKILVWLAAYAAASQVVTAAIVYTSSGKIDGLIGKLNFPKNGLLKAIPSSTTTSNDCASTATKGPDSPLCNEDVCQGSMGLCAVNPNRNCPSYAPSTTSATAITTGCSFETASLSKASSGSSKSMISNIVCKCNGTEQIKPIYAVSGTNTTSWCDIATPVPSGFTQVSATIGSLVSSTISNTCSFITTSYPKALASSSTSMIPATLCQCAHGDQLGPAYAVSGKSTTSWCDSTISVPAGFTKLSVSNGSPIPLSTVLSTKSSISTTSRTSTVLPSPTTEVLLIWSVPPVKGIVTYDAFLVPLGYSHDLNTDCTQVVALDNKIIPVLDAVPDPTYIVTTTVKGKPTTTTVDVESLPSGRPAGGLERRAPHSLGKLIGYDCTYEEPRFPEGSIKCGKTIWPCHLPTSDEEDSITPDYGSCGDIRNVRPLVMVCPANLVKG